MQKFRVMVAVLALISVACGSKSGSSGEMSADPVVLDIAEALQDDPNFAMSDEKANCAAQRIVDGLDDTTLDQMLANPDADLAEVADDEMALVVIDGIFDCADIEELMVRSMMEDGTPEDQARCVAEGFGEDELRSLMAMASTEQEPDDEAGLEILFKMFALANECGLDLG